VSLNQVNKRTLADCQVLIVDDQASSRLVLETLLEDVVSCVSVNSGEAAIRYCEQHNPDLILMDVYMPDLNGHDTCRRLKNDNIDIPIIFVTSSTSDEEESKCWASGCVDFVAKPVNACTLRNRVKSHLNHKLKNDLLESLIYIDRLTGTYNRHYLDDYLPALIKEGMRNATPVSLVLFDIDYFKRYNDHYGHIAGDNCLWKLSSAINDNLLRPMDRLIRIGGEEFLVLLPNTDHEGALNVSKRLLDSVYDLNIQHQESEFSRVTISAGVATKLHDDEKTIDFIMLQADKNLYAAKGNGRNCVANSPASCYNESSN